MRLQITSRWAAHGGEQLVCRHASQATRTDMNFRDLPASAGQAQQRVRCVWYLSGLTCTHANVMEKGEYRKAAAEHGIIVVCPDTSPRGDDVADDEAYDLGKGAGFYVDATQAPWSQHYQMKTYIQDELPELVADEFRVDMSRQGIFGHSMGGHGALTIALRHPRRFRSVSAFAPIVAPSQVPWGQKAFPAYLGDDKAQWRRHDAVALIEDGARVPDILVDQGDADNFLAEQLQAGASEEGLRGCRDRPDAQDAARLRPLLLLHLQLHARPHRLACGAAEAASDVGRGEGRTDEVHHVAERVDELHDLAVAFVARLFEEEHARCGETREVGGEIVGVEEQEAAPAGLVADAGLLLLVGGAGEEDVGPAAG